MAKSELAVLPAGLVVNSGTVWQCDRNAMVRWSSACKWDRK